MTYCVGILVQEGIVLGSDSRTNAGIDNFATFCKMTIFERRDERVIVLLSSGNLAGTQAVISIIRQRAADASAVGPTIWNARTMFDVAVAISDAVRDVERRDAPFLAKSAPFNASFIIGGQIRGDAMRLFRTFAEGNFIEAGTDTAFFQTGEAKYGKPIIDRVITPATPLTDAMKCVLVSFDSTMRSNLSVGMPIDLVAYERDSFRLSARQRFEAGDSYFSALSAQWRDGVRGVFRKLPDVPADASRPAPDIPTINANEE